MVTVLAALAGPNTNVSAPEAAGKRILAAAAVDDVGVGVADDRVDLGVARSADGDRGFEQHQPLEERAQGIADGAVNPVSAAVVDAGHCRLTDDVVHIVDVVVVVAGPAVHDVGAGITVHGVVTGPAIQRIVTGATVKVIAPAEARDGIVCCCAGEIVVKFGADNVCHDPDLRGAQLGLLLDPQMNC